MSDMNQNSTAWDITEDEERTILAHGDKSFTVTNSPFGKITPIHWGSELASMKMLNAAVGLQRGMQYNIYSYNLLSEKPKPTLIGLDVTTRDDNPNVLVRSEFSDVTFSNAMVINADNNELSFTVSLEKSGQGIDKYQILFGSAFELTGANDPCLAVPTVGGLKFFRSNEPSKQAICDQNSFRSFPHYERLSGDTFFVISGDDGKSFKLTGDQIKYCDFSDSVKLICFGAYGYDFFLEKGQSHTENFRFKLISGFGVDNLTGILEKRYVRGSNVAKVFFPAGDNATFKSNLTRDGEILRSASGTGNLEIDLSTLPDGDYEMNKEAVVEGETLSSTEPLTLLNAEFGRLLENLERIEKEKDSLVLVDTLAEIRARGIEFKLFNAREYLKCGELEQVDGLLKDADRILSALGSNEPAVPLSVKDVVYENDFTEVNDDFDYYGNGEVSFSKDKGLYLSPVITINMWSKFKLNGSFQVEFDYMPERGDTGGTMVQLCAEHFNPVQEKPLMASASGFMPHYNFGVKCYHFSFCRGQNFGSVADNPKPRVCNFRKTGKGFYVLNQIPVDPVPDNQGKWFQLRFVKNERQFLFFVNDQLVQEYFDEGHQGLFLDGGYFGVRNWSRRRAYFKNLKITTV